ncbi:MAG: MOP flippase family protein [Bacteroidales bacterium]|nr:MOP flippase family protein [Bacteroidales bacterium]
MTLKQKTINGIFWSAIDSFSVQGITFITGIVLARLLTPKEFGLIGMITIFIALSQSFIDSGFSSALIRKKDTTEADYSTVFYFNLIIGLFFFGILIISAPAISNFFNEPQLKNLVQVLGVVLIINSLTIIQRTTLTKRIDFKLQTKISFISSVFSGIVGITMAYNGFGVWSLAFKTISQQGMNSLLLWFWNRWRPTLIFSIQSFKELFSFGSKLLISGLIDTAYRNIYYLIIGKYFSAQELGFYTRAQMFNDLPSKNLNSIMSRVTYPVLAQLQDEPVKLKAGYKRMIKSVMFISMILMAGLAAIAEPLVIKLIGENWRPSIIYLQLLTFVGMMYPLHALNLNMLQVQGRSDLFLKLEIIKKILAVPTIIIGIIWGIKILILGMWVNNIISYYLNSYWSGRFIHYSIREQVSDIVPGFILAISVGLLVYMLGWLMPAGNLVKLIIQILSGGLLTISISEFFKFEAYMEIKNIVLDKLKELRNARK